MRDSFLCSVRISSAQRRRRHQDTGSGSPQVAVAPSGGHASRRDDRRPIAEGPSAGITFEIFPSEHTMPIRTASLSRQLHKNGQRLHLAMMSRAFSHGTDPAPSEQEKALREERNALKAAQAERRARALLPKAKPVKVVKEAKPAKAPKAPKAAKPPKEKAAKKSASKPSRADKQTKKAENLEAAKKADRKSAKT